MEDEWDEILLNDGMEQLAEVMKVVLRSTLPDDAAVDELVGELEAVVEGFLLEAESFTDINDAHTALDNLIWTFYPEMIAIHSMKRLDNIADALWYLWNSWLDITTVFIVREGVVEEW